ncbi:hypothetical protein B9479_001646 [Cryptococcus floricola]|uniref:GRIP domain-containing protein n=1 Tax=Cryptococcus floricola TaxID=2591691 RepID=A0A5D3B3Z2_9TREE|nr:hypothetical protein B9479_001646 [Cryptococcus floricola]
MPNKKSKAAKAAASTSAKAEQLVADDTVASPSNGDAQENENDNGEEGEPAVEELVPETRGASHGGAAVDDDDLSPEERVKLLEEELESTRQDKETLGNQYRSLLGKLTAMRTTLGDKLKEDAEELDRRETQITTLTSDNETFQHTIQTLQSELQSLTAESSSLSAQLSQIRSQSDSSSSDVLSLTREMRELRGEMERLRLEREEWEEEAGRERERREEGEEEMGRVERREREMRGEVERLREERDKERERADNLQEVLSEFQAAKDSELDQATHELETQLRLAATSLSDFKLRAANAETQLSEVSSDAKKVAALERDIKEKNQAIAKLRHDAVINNEHLTEALRRLRKNQSDNNVDRRLVTNILLSFLTAPRGDTKRFEILSLLSTILSWDDTEREKAGLQRQGVTGKSGARGGEDKKKRQDTEKSAEEEAAMNESFSNLFVEFLLKESSHGQPARPAGAEPHRTQSSISLNNSSPFSPGTSSMTYSPPPTIHSGFTSPQSRPRGLSTSSQTSAGGERVTMGGRRTSYGLREALEHGQHGQGY